MRQTKRLAWLLLIPVLACPGLWMLGALLEAQQLRQDQGRELELEKSRISLLEKEKNQSVPESRKENPGPAGSRPYQEEVRNPDQTMDTGRNPDQTMDSALAVMSAAEGIRLLSLSPPGPGDQADCRDIRLEGTLEDLLSCIRSSSRFPDHGFYRLELSPSREGSFFLQARYGPAAPDAGSRDLSGIFEPARLARLLGETKAPPRAGGTKSPGVQADRAGSKAESKTPAGSGPPGTRRFALRGVSRDEGGTSYLIKDLELDRMIWIPGDQDWQLAKKEGEKLILENGKGQREEVME